MRRKDRFGEERWGEENVPNLVRGYVPNYWLGRDGRMRADPHDIIYSDEEKADE
jgi:hypothetical protein